MSMPVKSKQSHSLRLAASGVLSNAGTFSVDPSQYSKNRVVRENLKKAAYFRATENKRERIKEKVA